jgi:hypothetical protein
MNGHVRAVHAPQEPRLGAMLINFRNEGGDRVGLNRAVRKLRTCGGLGAVE